MKNFKVKSKDVFVHIEVPIDAQSLKGDALFQVIIGKLKDGSGFWREVELLDFTNISFMGMKVENGDKFIKKMSDEFGINVWNIVEKESEFLDQHHPIIESLVDQVKVIF